MNLLMWGMNIYVNQLQKIFLLKIKILSGTSMINVNQFQKISLPGLFCGQLMQRTNDSKTVSKYQNQQQ